MLKLKVLENFEISLISIFLRNAGNSLNSFRYFNNRPLSIIKNHLTTCLLILGDEPIGYGHLDQEDKTIWLGIAIIEKYTGKGFGKIIMDYLLNFAKTSNIEYVNLTVDIENANAIKLYKKLGFKTHSMINNNSILMKLDLHA